MKHESMWFQNFQLQILLPKATICQLLSDILHVLSHNTRHFPQSNWQLTSTSKYFDELHNYNYYFGACSSSLHHFHRSSLLMEVQRI